MRTMDSLEVTATNMTTVMMPYMYVMPTYCSCLMNWNKVQQV